MLTGCWRILEEFFLKKKKKKDLGHNNDLFLKSNQLNWSRQRLKFGFTDSFLVLSFKCREQLYNN